MDHIVEINGLSKDYETGFWRKRRVRAVDALDLNVKPGGIFGFLGGNGAGKTTTIKILMGLLFPTEGSAKILGRDIADVEMRSRIGYCPENPYFYDYLTANELMDYFGRIFGLNAADRATRTAELLDAVGIRERDRGRQLRKFSKGMLQRVGLAQALINSPEIVFLDEPMSGLDPVGRREIRELIAGLREKGTTVFMSTHILSDVEALCDEVAILRGGKLAAKGVLEDLLYRENTTELFEVRLANADPEKLLGALGPGIDIVENAGSVTLTVETFETVEKILHIARTQGANLTTVLPVRQSLEDLFVGESES